MTNKLSVDAICNKYPHEWPHARHVTMLALEIFDSLKAQLKLTDTQRRMLETACRLHDVGFGGNQPEHAARSAEITIEEGIRGFTTTQVQQIASAILMHRKNYHKCLDHPIVSSLKNQHSAMKLAAILRIADGLDHGHIQDGRISGITKNNKTILLKVASPGYSGNAAWTNEKADLWNEAFPYPVQIFNENKPARWRYYGVINRRNTTLAAARKLMFYQFRVIGDNRQAAINGDDFEHLHNIRVAARRLKELLRIFNGNLKQTSCKQVQELLAQMTSQLGNIRDTQVWLAFLERLDHDKRIPRDQNWASYLAKQQEIEQSLHSHLAALLDSQLFWRFWIRTNHFLRIELPGLEHNRKNEKNSARFFAGKLKIIHRNFCRTKININKLTPARLHKLRKRCRRARYISEFAGPVLGNTIRQYARRFEKLVDSLGTVHDMDVHLGRLVHDKEYEIPELVRIMENTRADAFEKTIRAWKKLMDRSLSRKVTRQLKKNA